MAMKSTFINFALAGLFIMAFFTFAITFQTNNGVTDTIENDALINRTIIDLNRNMETFDDKLQNQSVNQDEDNPSTEGGSLLFISITKTGNVLKGMVTGVYNALIVIPAGMLGVPQFVVIIITSIVTLVLILGAWRLYKAGE
jgi:hypothetical protein